MSLNIRLNAISLLESDNNVLCSLLQLIYRSLHRYQIIDSSPTVYNSGKFWLIGESTVDFQVD